MTADNETSARPGSGPDLSRRMDRIEGRQDTLDAKVTDLASVIARVELNQKHAEEVNSLRHAGLETSIKNIDNSLTQFMDRINKLISGEVRLPSNDALMKDWRDWRTSQEAKHREAEVRLDAQDVRNGRLDLIGKVAVILLTGNIGAIVTGIYILLNSPRPTP